MNLALVVNKKESMNVPALLKKVCHLQCQIKIDLKNGKILVSDLADEKVEKMIDVINDAFEVASIDIIQKTDDANPEDSITTESAIDLTKLRYINVELQEQINELLRLISWAVYYKKAKNDDICKYLKTVEKEIAMRYKPRIPVKFAVGDIVECDYGSHLQSEISGHYVHAIVCDIDEKGLIYAVPISKYHIEEDANKYLPFSSNVEVQYIESKFTGGTVLLKMGRYMHSQRVNKVVGHLSPEFFASLMKTLPITFDFSDNYGDEEEIFETMKKKQTKERKDQIKQYLTNVFSEAWNLLDKTKPVKEQVGEFLKTIGFENTRIMQEAFIAAHEVKKVNFNSILIELHNQFPTMEEKELEKIIKNYFKRWLTTQHQDLKEKYSKISIVDFFKIFAEKLA